VLILKEKTNSDPRQGKVGGNRKSRSFKICPVCLGVYGPLNRLDRKSCSLACKHEAQRTGRRTFRKTSRRARNAQSLVRYHVEAGNIIRPDACEECGTTDVQVEAAHYDYNKPLKVRWLCPSCHRKWDCEEPKGATFIVKTPRTSAEEKAPTGDAEAFQEGE